MEQPCPSTSENHSGQHVSTVATTMKPNFRVFVMEADDRVTIFLNAFLSLRAFQRPSVFGVHQLMFVIFAGTMTPHTLSIRVFSSVHFTPIPVSNIIRRQIINDEDKSLNKSCDAPKWKHLSYTVGNDLPSVNCNHFYLSQIYYSNWRCKRSAGISYANQLPPSTIVDQLNLTVCGRRSVTDTNVEIRPIRK